MADDSVTTAADSAADERLFSCWITKEGHFFRTWRKRWMVFDGNARQICYFKTKEACDAGAEPKGMDTVGDSTVADYRGIETLVLTCRGGKMFYVRFEQKTDMLRANAVFGNRMHASFADGGVSADGGTVTHSQVKRVDVPLDVTGRTMLKSGNLEKLSSGGISRRWQQRFFSLYAGGALAYREADRPESDILAWFDISDAVIQPPTTASPCAIVLLWHGGAQLSLRAPSLGGAGQWRAQLSAALGSAAPPATARHPSLFAWTHPCTLRVPVSRSGILLMAAPHGMRPRPPPFARSRRVSPRRQSPLFAHQPSDPHIGRLPRTACGWYDPS